MNDLTILLFDVISYLNDRGILFTSERLDRGWLNLKCPFCSDSGEHLGVQIANNIFSCWKCGEKGSVTKLVKEIEHHVTFPETLELIEKYQDFGRMGLIGLPEESNSKITHLEIPKNYIKLSWPTVPDIVINFLLKRGFDPEVFIRSRESYYGGHTGHFKFRLILPITLRGRLVSWVGRDVTGRSEIKYRNLEEEKSILPAKNTLYGFDEAPPGSNIVVVEGPLDQIRLGAGSVATYGTAWTDRQVTLLRELNPNSVTILYDSEIEAQKSAKQLARQIWFANCEVVELNGVKDPGELTVEQGKELMRSLI
jgi:DNA primase